LAWITSGYLDRPAEGERWNRLAQVLLDRLPDGSEQLRSWLLNDQGMLRMHSGRLQEGLQLAKEALALKRAILRPDDPDIGRTLGNVAEALHRLGNDQAALTEIDEALRLLVAAYGPSAFQVVMAVNERGESLAGLGRHEEALTSFQEALTQGQAQLAPDHRILAYPLTGLGQVLLALGRPLEARPPLERAWKIRESREPSVTERGDTAFALARAVWDTGDRRRARSLAQTARATYEKQATLHAREIREIDVWLVRHR
jgi:tetratricopeptide (TPR) repeat protein